MFKLPKDLIINIYNFDNTYQIYFNECIKELKNIYESYTKKTDQYDTYIINGISYMYKKYTYIDADDIKNYNQYLLYILHDK